MEITKTSRLLLLFGRYSSLPFWLYQFGRIIRRACCSSIYLRSSIGFLPHHPKLSTEIICQPYWIPAQFRLLRENLSKLRNDVGIIRLLQIILHELTDNKLLSIQQLSLTRVRRLGADGLYQRRYKTNFDLRIQIYVVSCLIGMMTTCRKFKLL